MANISGYNYEEIDIPYNNLLERSSMEAGMEVSKISGVTIDPFNNQEQIISGQQLEDVFLSSWMKSSNYRPKQFGFLIDGRRGYIECMKIFVGSGGLIASETGGDNQARIEIIGNDMNLYDESIGGTSPITGDSAEINFIRAVDEDKRFIMRGRAGINHVDETVIEMFHNENADNNQRNYIFMGIRGDESSANDWHTDVFRVGAVQTMQLGTNERYSDNIPEFNIETSSWRGQSWESGGSRILITPMQTTAGSGYDPYNAATTGGAAIVFAFQENSGYVHHAWFDKDGFWLGGETIYPFINGGSDLGNASHRFGSAYINTAHITTGNITTVNASTVNTNVLTSGATVICHTGLRPLNNNSLDFGTSGKRWKDIYAININLDGTVIMDGDFYSNSGDVNLLKTGAKVKIKDSGGTLRTLEAVLYNGKYTLREA